MTPTCGTAAANRSGRCSSTAPTSKPPFDRAEDREALAAGPVLRRQIFGGGDEVIEYILLVRLHPRLVPGAPVLSAAAQIRNRVHPAQLEPCGDAGRKRRLQWNH